MATTMKIEAGEGVRQAKNVFYVDPGQVIVHPENNPRKDRVSRESRAALKADIKARGQLVPVTCVKGADHRLTLTSGYNRHEVVSELHKEDPNFLLKVEVLTGLDELQAFMVNIRDNCLRNEWTTADKAQAASMLKHRYGLDDPAIAQAFDCTTAHVRNFWAFLMAPAELKEAVQEGAISAASAIEVVKSNGLSPEEVGELVKKAKAKKAETGQPLRSKQVTEAVREIKEKKTAPESDDRPIRSRSMLYKLLQARAEASSKKKDFPITWAILDYLDGRYSDNRLEDVLSQYEVPQIEE